MATPPTSPTPQSIFDWEKTLVQKFLESVCNVFSRDGSGSFTRQSQLAEDDGRISPSQRQLAVKSSWRNSEVLSPEDVRDYMTYNGSKTSKDTRPVHYFKATTKYMEEMPVRLCDEEVLKDQRAQIVMKQEGGYEMLREVRKRNRPLYCLVLLRSMLCI